MGALFQAHGAIAPARAFSGDFPGSFGWRSRLGFDGLLLGAVVGKFADAVLAFDYPSLPTCVRQIPNTLTAMTPALT